MVARTPPKQRRAMAALNPALLRETVAKVDRCMARLQELQYTVSGGTKVISGVSLSPRSTRGYLRASLRCKQESLRINGGAPRKSPVGKFPANSGDWRRVSLPAMLVGETVGEILQASQFAKEIVAAIAHKTKKIAPEDPRTPLTQRKQRPPPLEETELRARRKKEKQNKPNAVRSDSTSPKLRRARSRINFKVSPPSKRESEKENAQYLANRVSPRHKPWAKKAVLFPNPLFSTTTATSEPKKFCRTRSPVIERTKPSSHVSPHKFCRTRSPVIARMKPSPHVSPHKFLIKSPAPPPVSKFQVKIKSPPRITLSPPQRASSGTKKSPKMSTTSKLRRSFSPSRLASRLVSLSPLKSRRSSSIYSKNDESTKAVNGLKQRPSCSIPMGISSRRI